MEVAEDKTASSTPIPEGVSVTKREAQQAKRGRGRPPKPFISELPAPPKFEITAPGPFFTYLKSIPKDKLPRIMLTFYRFHPVCDMTEGGTKDKLLEKIPGENHPFIEDDWELQLLHRYGSGTYACYLNELNRTVCRCMKIETRWDLEGYPPIVDPLWVDQAHPQNRAFVQYLRSKGVALPSAADKEKEQGDMQLAETNSKLIDTLIARSTPVPQIRQDSVSDKIALETAKAGIEMATQQAKQIMTSNVKEGNPLELVDKIVSVADKMTARNGGSDDTTKLIMTSMMEDRKEARERAQRAEERHERLMERMFAQRDNPATQPKSLIEQMREMAEMRTLMSDAFGTGAAAEESKETIPEMLIKNAPTLLQTGLGMFTQFNQSLGLMARMKELEVMRVSGQAPTVVTPPPAQAAQPSQPQVTAQQPTAQHPMNPATNQPYTDEELETIRQERAQYAAYHGFIAEISEPLINHLNGRHPESNEPLNGYDFAGWFITGKGRLAYDTVKSVGPETLLNALKTYPPVWNVIGGVEPRVKQFLGEFLTLDEMLQEDDEDGDDNNEGDKK